MMFEKEEIASLNLKLKGSDASEICKFFIENLNDKITFGSSLGIEDQVITHILLNLKPDFHIFTLDTGRLFPETYELIDRTNNKYKTKIDVIFPDYHEVEDFVKLNGINSFYKSIDMRKQCCHIRKLNPLKRALDGYDAWFTGLRRLQAITRGEMQIVEWDSNSNLLKINPLIDWSENDVWKYINDNKIPYNTLHDKSYPSIGCQPCTRAIQKGEDIRAGRWWWENPDTKECGLHAKG